MTRFRYAIVTMLAAGAFIALFVGVALIAPRPRLIWNASASAPIGLYRIAAVDYPDVGDLVAITPPPALARFMADRHYLPLDVPLLKHVAARRGTRVCRSDDRITIDGRYVATARPRDRRGRPLPVWRGCRVVGPGALFLLNAAADSMDGRYFGPIPSIGLIGRATPILTRDAAGAPLHWRDSGTRIASSSTDQGDVSWR